MFSLIVLLSLVFYVSQAATEDCACSDISPDSDFSCLQQKLWNKCTETWMIDGKFCEETCNRCTCETTTTTIDQKDSANVQAATTGDAQQAINVNAPQLPKQATKNIDKLQDLVHQYGTIQVPSVEEDENNLIVDEFNISVSSYSQSSSINSNDVLTEEYYYVPAPEEEMIVSTVQETANDSYASDQADELQSAAKLLASSGQTQQSQEAPIFEVEEAAVLRGNSPKPVPVPSPSPSPVETPSAKEIRKSVPIRDNSGDAALAEFRKPADDNPLLGVQKECTPLSAILQGTPGLQQFYRLLNLLDYGETEWGSSITLFAPIDIGVANFLRDYNLKLDDLDKMDDLQLSSLRSKFQPIVRYHFVDSSVTSSAVQMLNQLRLETRFMGKLVYARKIGSSNGFELIDGQGDKCNVLIADLVACEGIVHMVGCMLIPDL